MKLFFKETVRQVSFTFVPTTRAQPVQISLLVITKEIQLEVKNSFKRKISSKMSLLANHRPAFEPNNAIQTDAASSNANIRAQNLLQGLLSHEGSGTLPVTSLGTCDSPPQRSSSRRGTSTAGWRGGGPFRHPPKAAKSRNIIACPDSRAGKREGKLAS